MPEGTKIESKTRFTYDSGKRRGVPYPLERSLYDNGEPVDTSGYIPLQNRIEGMILAGERLTEARAELYDTDQNWDMSDDPADLRLRDVYETDVAVITQMKLHLEESVKLYEMYVKEHDEKKQFESALEKAGLKLQDILKYQEEKLGIVPENEPEQA